VIYELHVGTFTPEGTYAAAAERLRDLAELGVTCIELLPLAAFAGERGWGYDGVLPYAPHAAYGSPDDLKRFVQSAHEVGLSVLIDVVYNHFGPDGNYLGRYAAPFFTAKHHTPWGDAIDFEKAEVREFFIHNALYWIEEYHFDGLRIDAVHAMYDDGPRHFIDELVDRVQSIANRNRPAHIVLENHHNEARRLRSAGVSQWNDDYHHAVHVLTTGETEGYYQDYAERPLWQLGRALAHGFIYQGERSKVSGEPRGEPSSQLPVSAFVNFLQNHDQVGNRALGERLSVLAEPQAVGAGLALLLLAPHLPMLFMGEEYAARQPFFYFCDYQGELAAAVREGRRSEFKGFAAFSDPKRREKIPDPNARSTFEQSQLNWEERASSAHRHWWDFTRSLLQLRSHVIAPLIPRLVPARSEFNIENDVLNVTWSDAQGATLQVIANLKATGARVTQPSIGRLIFSSLPRGETGATAESLAAWEVRFFARD
jgi:malto-oligosyltrehalose trehalohydrolase